MQILQQFFNKDKNASAKSFKKGIHNVLGIKPDNIHVYTAALSHRSVKELPEENNERLEYLGDAILSAIVADYLFKRYPYKGEGFLTEMRSKMVNRQQLNDIAVKMGIKKIALFNKLDSALKNSNIFGNTLEAIVGAVYLDKGYRKTQTWVLKQIIIPHMFVDDLELIDINLKNKLIGWASKNNHSLTFDLNEEKLEGSRRVFIINTVLDGEILSQGKGFNKKDASQAAAISAIEKLGL
ncbi:ribonuclease III [Parasediminibacterium sp. JCM 36343]|uniref:ribonuclease III n=1 Tax=Parasediminibacterium sp. JCM 36343 TaxID=3374279 RepID=UPI00397C10A1